MRLCECQAQGAWLVGKTKVKQIPSQKPHLFGPFSDGVGRLLLLALGATLAFALGYFVELHSIF